MAAALSILVDYDNVDSAFRSPGPVACAKVIVSALDQTVTRDHSHARVRLYGGWRSNGSLTQVAQKLIPDIRKHSPIAVVVRGRASPITVSVETAEGPMGSNVKLAETFARDRQVRTFRTRPSSLRTCVDIHSCGLKPLYRLSQRDPCPTAGCGATLGELLVQDEQKMVDTLIVADLAYESLTTKSSEIVIVSSDSDIWPGILLALSGGVFVNHIHPRRGWSTPRHLLQTLSPTLTARYKQSSL